MTIIEAYEGVLIELNKVKAPSLSLSDFLYFFNKATQQFVNEMYSTYEINQQRVDDLRVLRNTVKLELKESPDQSSNNFYQCVYETELPEDYLHILNCIVEFQVTKSNRCGNKSSIVHYGAKRLSSDSNPQLIDNYYLKPSYKNPYYYINNIDISSGNSSGDITNQDVGNEPIKRTYKKYIIDLANLGTPNKVTIELYTSEDTKTIITVPNCQKDKAVLLYRALLKEKNSNNTFKSLKVEMTTSNIIEISSPVLTDVTCSNAMVTEGQETDFFQDKESYVRYGNASKSRMEIRFGKTKDEAVPRYVFVDYLRVPQRISLTSNQIDDIEDNSQVIEFPDYVVYELINRVAKLILENIGNPRVQTNVAVNASVPPPATVK